MTNNTSDFDRFRNLHSKKSPLILLNIWDAGSAKIVANAGAKAIATGSWAVAMANGYEDGEALPFTLALHTLKQIVAAVDLPVSMDIESGYGNTPAQLAETVKRVLDAGAVGINLEDQVIGENRLYSISEQASRLEACRKSADAFGVPLFINARSDLFLQAKEDADMAQLEREILMRAEAYQQAGADGLFTPGLLHEAAIETLCESSPMPVNIMIMPNGPPLEALMKIGVPRISHGPGPYLSAMESMETQSKLIYGQGS